MPITPKPVNIIVSRNWEYTISVGLPNTNAPKYKRGGVNATYNNVATAIHLYFIKKSKNSFPLARN